MDNEPNKIKVGLFLVLGFLLLIGIIGSFAITKLQTDKHSLAVLYFDESIKGLNVGSPVVFKGVEIGRVAKIELVEQESGLKFFAPVYIKFKPVIVKYHKSFWDRFSGQNDTLAFLIQQGLRGRLATMSYLTGQLMIELVMLPETSIPPLHHTLGNKGFVEIPTVLSPAGALSQGLEEVSLKNMLTKLGRVLDSLQTQMPVLMPALAQTAQNLQVITAPKGIQGTLQNINTTLNSMDDMARSVRNLTDYLERHPEAIIQGKRGK